MDRECAVQPFRATLGFHGVQISLRAGVGLRTASPPGRTEARERHLRSLHPHLPKKMPVFLQGFAPIAGSALQYAGKEIKILLV